MVTLEIIQEGRMEGTGGLPPPLKLFDNSFLIIAKEKDSTGFVQVTKDSSKHLSVDF